jgi:hypothetical protein
MTTPARSRSTVLGARILLAMAGGAALGCGHAGAPAPASAPGSGSGARAGNTELVLESDMQSRGQDVGAAWLIYGMALVAGTEKPGAQPHDYAGEVEARSAIAEFWAPKRAEGAHDPELDLLSDVRAAGFMSEYAIVFLARPGWVVPGPSVARLNLDGFRRWMPGHIPAHHTPATHAEVHVPGPPPPVPGQSLPAPEELDPRRVPCPSLQPVVAAALHRWDEEESHLGQVPLSVSAADQLIPTFVLAARDARARRAGVVLIDPRVGNAAFVAGFCAVETGALDDAERLLRRAVALSPGNANARGELVQTLILQKRLDDADAQLDVALDAAVSACHAGVLWRKRGYILFERRKLVDSYHAYARSLEYEPGNAIALKEMALIVKTLRAAGGYDEKALKSFVPPPAGKLSVTECR